MKNKKKISNRFLIIFTITFLFSGCIKNIPSSPGNQNLEKFRGILKETDKDKVILTTLDNKEFLLSGELIDELRRLSGIKVIVIAEKGGISDSLTILNVKNYEIQDVGAGNKPLVGYIFLKENLLYLKLENGEDIRISGEVFSKDLNSILGAKIWVVGYKTTKSNILRVYNYGIIKPPS